MAADEAELPEREAMDFDVVIVGAGPAGLAAAIRLKQKAAAAGSEISVVVVEKGSEVGAHILSGAVIDPVGLNRLIPDWKQRGAPVDTLVTEDQFLVLGPEGDIRLPNWPMPPLMKPTAITSSALARSANGSASRQQSLASKSTRASPQPRSFTTRPARLLALPPAIWALAATASQKKILFAAWSCAASTH